MKKIILSSFIILTLSFNSSFAQEEGVLSSFIENKNTAIREIKSFFGAEKVSLPKIELEDKEAYVNLKQENTTSSSSQVIISTPTSSSTSVVSKSSSTEKVLCENKKTLSSKKEKVNAQIKNQIKDKNKLIDKLLEISADSATTTKEVFDSKILKLESEVSEAIKIQKNILNIITSSTNGVCDVVSSAIVTSASSSLLNESSAKKPLMVSKENKEYSGINKSIKKLELENEKQLGKINKFIKTDIKNILVEINSEESN